MALSDNGFTMPVTPAYGYGNNGFGGDGLYGIIVLFILMGMMNNGGFGGWGNGGGGNGFVNAEVQRGFDQSALTGAINGVQASVNGISPQLCSGFAGVNQTISSGFAGAEIAENARQMANMQQTWNSQQSLENRLDTIAQNQQNCCCENRLAMANLTSTILAENCADRQALSDGVRDILAATQAQTQTVLTQMCNDKIDEKNERIIDLQNKLNMAELRESQNLQTGILLANNASQTQQLLATGTAAGRSTTNGTSS